MRTAHQHGAELLEIAVARARYLNAHHFAGAQPHSRHLSFGGVWFFGRFGTDSMHHPTLLGIASKGYSPGVIFFGQSANGTTEKLLESGHSRSED